ncbi:MAG: hypothetical protein N4A46_15510 [Schleiferiaceae bacterium]|nr:hypothetical protein [Schleiferiaceae bacterium]
MNKNKIIECINNPALIDEEATKELRDIVHEFPASPILHWLYLKGLQNQKSYLFNSALSRAAIGSPNRSQLMKWVDKEGEEPEVVKKQKFEFKLPEKEVQTKEEVQPIVEPSVIPEEKTPQEPEAKKEVQVVQELPKPEPKVEKPKKEKKPADLPADILAILEKSKRIREGYKHEEEELVDTEVTADAVSDVIVEEPIEEVAEPVQNSEIPIDTHIEPIAVEETTETVEGPIEEPQREEKEQYFEVDLNFGDVDENITQEEVSQETAFETSFEIVLDDYESDLPLEQGEEVKDVDQKEEVESQVEVKESTSTLEGSFMGWLKNLDSENKPKENVSFEINTDVVPQKKKEVSKEKAHRIGLIDKFLEDKPRITPSKEYISLVNLADEEEEDNKQFITETLAEIYVKQGHYNKALEAYEILGLKYPEKSSLFADRIREIKRRK